MRNIEGETMRTDKEILDYLARMEGPDFAALICSVQNNLSELRKKVSEKIEPAKKCTNCCFLQELNSSIGRCCFPVQDTMPASIRWRSPDAIQLQFPFSDCPAWKEKS